MPSLNKNRKRNRPDTNVQSHSSDALNEADDASIEIVEKLEDSTVLLRFPCFDFFRNTHICETTSTSSDEPYAFDPSRVEVDKASSLLSEHPVIVLNRGETNEMRFIGGWKSNALKAGATNQAVVCMSEMSDVENQEGRSGNVASLFTHSQLGQTSDEVRAKKTKSSGMMKTAAIYIPSALLVMHPVS